MDQILTRELCKKKVSDLRPEFWIFQSLTCALGPDRLVAIYIDFSDIGPIFFQVGAADDVGDEGDFWDVISKHHFDLVFGKH